MSEGLTMSQLQERNALLVTENEALKEQRDALAAENAVLKLAIETHKHGFMRCKCCGEENMCHNDDVCRALDETPATDAYLNSVRAEGADKVAEYHFVRIEALKEVSRQGHLFHKAAYSDAVNVANLFRAGEPS